MTGEIGSDTYELRRLLDERGVEYETYDPPYPEFSTPTSDITTRWGNASYREWPNGTIRFSARGTTPEQAIAATLGVGRASGFQWHLMVDEAPEYGANDFVVMGMRGAMYLASEYSKYSQDGKGAYFYIPNRRDNFMDKKQVLAWAEIPPLEVTE